MSDPMRPTLAQPRATTNLSRESLLDRVIANTSQGFDIDAFHVMEQRDEALIRDEIINGAQSTKFVYSFPIAGQKDPVSGVSVIGARQLAYHYGGLHHRLIASTHKTGSLFVFTSFPAGESPMRVSASTIRELEDEPDYYSVVIEVSDIKNGNSIQIERSEKRLEWSENGKRWFDRPNYTTIAQSKAYRNGVLALVPQDIRIKWMLQQLQLGKTEIITESIIDEKRSAVLRFAASKSIPIDRNKVNELGMDQIAGLADAARAEGLPAFTQAAQALGLLGDGVVDDDEKSKPDSKPVGAAPPARRGRPPGFGKAAAAQTGNTAGPTGPEPPPAGETVSTAVGGQEPLAQQQRTPEASQQPEDREPDQTPPATRRRSL